MARIITMPSTPNFIRSQFRLFRAIGQTASPFTGKQLSQEFDAVFWEAEVTLPPLNRSQAVEWQSFLMQLMNLQLCFHILLDIHQSLQNVL